MSKLEKVEVGGRVRRGSEGNLEDLWKRKREALGEGGGEEQWMFKAGKKVQRSPQESPKGRHEREEGSERREERGGEEWREELRKVGREMNEGFKSAVEEMKEIMKGMKKALLGEIEGMRKEIGGLKKEMREKQEEWRKEKEGLEERVKGMEERMGSMGEWKKKGEDGMEERVRRMERRMEQKERQERRNNVLIRGLRRRDEKGRKEEVEELLKELGVESGTEEIKEIRARKGEGSGGGSGGIIVKLKGREQKRAVMVGRGKVREKGIRIEDDLTWEERRMKWKIEDRAWEERRKGRRVWVGYGRIQVEGRWWIWNEDKEELVLMDEKGGDEGRQGEEMNGNGRGKG